MNNPLRILIIEDDADTRANLRDILELDGHQIFSVASYAESKSVTSEHDIGLIITDRRLPEGMIDDFLPQLRSDASDAEIIVVTGYGDMQSTITALRLGIADYVIKPIIPDDIRTSVNRIASKQRLEARLIEEHQFANEVLQTADAIVLVLNLKGEVIQFNRFFAELTGWTEEDIVGKDWFANCIAERDQDWIRKIFIETAHNVHSRGVINNVCGRDGTTFKIRWSNTTLKKADGTVHAVLAIGVDITDLGEAQERALQAERLAAIGQTMTALAHESRNALQRIKAASEVLALEVEGNANAEEDIRSIQRATNDLHCLLEEVRSFAAPIQVQPALTHLPDIWRLAWSDVATMRKSRDTKLIESTNGCDLNVEVDSARIGQVFRNLFENSLAATHDPVRIDVKCFCEKDAVVVHCSDNGPGLSLEQRQKLFEPFYTTKNTGTGLGMSICQRIIETHGGTIEIKPSDRGACIAIRLPRFKQ